MRFVVACILLAASIPISAQESSGFLKTDYAPLSEWLDERFEIDYKDMTPALIFDQVPLNDIFYETENLPNDVPRFNFQSENISRRELLLHISEHWNFSMTFSFGEDGNPNAVIVTALAPNGDNGI